MSTTQRHHHSFLNGRSSLLRLDSAATPLDAFSQIFQHLHAEIPQIMHYVAVMDATVNAIYAAHVERAFSTSLPQQNLLLLTIPEGEPSKSRATKEWLENALFERLPPTRSRSTLCLLAIGGGVVGDLTGYVASTFLRGVPVIQIPTTLLAMVDSSIGGKTGVDVRWGKNLIGSIWQPRVVVIWPRFLKTLADREWRNGMAEVLKTAWALDAELVGLLDDGLRENKLSVEQDDVETWSWWMRLIWRTALNKTRIVDEDEHEQHARSLLNFGHTVGHAIESRLTPELLHGEAVAVGMVKEAEIARALGHLDAETFARLVRMISACGLPTTMDAGLLKEIAEQTQRPLTWVSMEKYLQVDKKNVGAQKRVVLVNGVGRTVERKATAVSDDLLQLAMCSAVTVPRLISSKRVFELSPPGSKSISNRALLTAALGKGTCRLHGLLHSDDTQVMLAALQAVGECKFEWEQEGKVLVVHGCHGRLVGNSRGDPLFLGNAGTAARFLTTVCTLVESAEKQIVLTGNARMKQRPIGPLVKALTENGCRIAYQESEGCLPLVISGGGLRGGEIRLAANVSSQYVSSVLLSAPYAKQEVTLVLGGEGEEEHVVSQPYIDMTIAMMKSFGVQVERSTSRKNTYRIPNTGYSNPGEYHVEIDASSATYPLALAAVTGTSVIVHGLSAQSLQGDAGFVQLLEKMGSHISAPSSSSIRLDGPPRGHLRALGTIDMEPMTDAFLTASVVAACACQPSLDGDLVTKIHGISNQRVKECNRIEAMITELSKFGVRAWELNDGIAVQGVGDLTRLRSPADGVHCYDDHRVAMSFSVLACAIPDGQAPVFVQEKKCVEKTWPTWWDTLMRVFEVDVRGADYTPAGKPQPALPPTVVIIGMRGVGKTTMGRHVASALGRLFIDLDEYIEAEHTDRRSVQDFVRVQGWDSFRNVESMALKECLSKRGAVLSCGGGVVEIEANRRLLSDFKRHSPVIHLQRDMKQVVEYLRTDPSRPSFTEDIMQVWERRRTWFRECSSYDFEISTSSVSGCTEWHVSQQRLVAMVRRVSLGKVPIPAFDREQRLVNDEYSSKQASYFVSLTFEDHAVVEDTIRQVVEGCDAVEVRADLFKSHQHAFITRQVATLRDLVPHLPLIFTVRTTTQGGKFPRAPVDNVFSLLELGQRLGCEYVDVEVDLPFERVRQFIANGPPTTRYLGSYHHIDQPDATYSCWTERMHLKFAKAYKFADIIKLVGYAHRMSDNLALFDFARHERVLGATKPLIAINMGQTGSITRVLNAFMTPITHERMPTVAAPGQLTLKEINQRRHEMGVLPARRFYLLGSPIRASMSPTLHNTGFKELGLETYQYELFETDEVSPDLMLLLKDRRFGGASVTIPLKEKIQAHLDELTQAAKDIGAVNTITFNPSTRQLLGDNTDWLGIRQVILKHRSTAIDKLATPSVSVLVIGSGGTARAACYAAKHLRLSGKTTSLYIWNRTASKAQSLAKEFGGEAVVQVPANISIVVSTIPAQAHAELPEEFLKQVFAASSGVFVELAYRPRRTRLLQQAASRQWATVEGIDILIEQGYEQFVRWTGLHPPRAIMRQAVMESYTD